MGLLFKTLSVSVLLLSLSIITVTVDSSNSIALDIDDYVETSPNYVYLTNNQVDVESGGGVIYTDSVEDVDTSTDVVYVDDSWINSNLVYAYELKSLSDAGVPVVSVNGPDVFIDNPEFGSVAFSDDSEYCGYYRDSSNNVTYCYSVDCDDPETAMMRSQSWASKVVTGSNSIIPDENDVIYTKELQCGDNGWFFIEAKYSKEGTYNGYDYWTVNYYLESTPDSGSYTTMMKVYDDFGGLPLDGQLEAHGPNTTEGSSTSSIGATISVDGLGISISTEYSISDVTVINNSSRVTDVYSITHNLVRGTAVSASTYYCKPIAIIKCDYGDSDYAYCPTDQYTICFDRIVDSEWVTETYSTSVQAILYPDR